MELMQNCQDVSYGEGEGVDQEIEKNSDSPGIPASSDYLCFSDEGHYAGWGDSREPQSSITSKGNSPSKKRERDSNCSESGNRFRRYFQRSTDSPALKRTKKCLDPVLAETSERESPPEVMPQKRKRDEADECLTSDCISPAKKTRSVNLNQELMDSVNKFFSSTEVACPTVTLVDHPTKRKRDDDDSSDSEEDRTSQVKMRRASLDENLQTDN
ncbi:uncharacterized protein [Labrus bergylta]|uniref:uncharacterized protein n=1 Tax=Labrus bergylta TaxID=56723 RepID=UPI003313583F